MLSVFLEMHFQGVWEPIGGGDHFRGSGELSGDALKTAWDGTGTNLGLGSLSGSTLGLGGCHSVENIEKTMVFARFLQATLQNAWFLHGFGRPTLEKA